MSVPEFQCSDPGQAEGGYDSVTGEFRSFIHGPFHSDRVEFTLELGELGFSSGRAVAGHGLMGKESTRFEYGGGIAPEIAAGQYFLLRSGNRFLLAGLLSWNVFTTQLLLRDAVLVIRSCIDGKVFLPGQSFPLETIFLRESTDRNALLEEYAGCLAREHGTAISGRLWLGWGSWDYYADGVGEACVRENAALLPPGSLVQIDDGYCVAGDWLEVNPETFPGGMEKVTREIEAAGQVPGIWCAPFLAHRDSRLFREHPEYFLRRADGSPLSLGTSPNYVLDYSQDAVCDRIAETVSHMRDRWHIRYFKFDFLCAGTMPCRGRVADRTALERFHRCMGAIRSVLGKESYLLGCSAEFGPCMGYVDGMRTGPDISPGFDSVRKAALCNADHFYLHRKIFNCDPDYLVVRAAEDEREDVAKSSLKHGTLTETEAQVWRDFVTLFGGSVIAGDRLAALRPARRELLWGAFRDKEVLDCVPLDDWERGDGMPPSVLLAWKDVRVRIGLFNWENKSAPVQLKGLLPGEAEFPRELPAHSSVIVEYRGRRTGEELAAVLRVGSEAPEKRFHAVRNADFLLSGVPEPIPLGDAADCPIRFDRSGAVGIWEGAYEGILSKTSFLGIPFRLGENAVCLSSAPAEIPVGRKLKRLYLLHSTEFPVSGVLNSILLHYGNRSVEVELVLGTHIGNNNLQYVPDTAGTDICRIAWHDPRTDACLFLLKLELPEPEEILEKITISPLRQRGNYLLFGITGEA